MPTLAGIAENRRMRSQVPLTTSSILPFACRKFSGHGLGTEAVNFSLRNQHRPVRGAQAESPDVAESQRIAILTHTRRANGDSVVTNTRPGTLTNLEFAWFSLASHEFAVDKVPSPSLTTE